MQQFNQEALDAHLAELSRNLTPEQTEQLQQKVNQRIQTSGSTYSAESVEGAFALIDTLARAGTSATELRPSAKELERRSMPRTSTLMQPALTSRTSLGSRGGTRSLPRPPMTGKSR